MTNELEAEALASYMERIEQLENQRTEVGNLIKGVFTEAESKGFDAQTIAYAVEICKMRPEDRQALDEILQIYMLAHGEK